MEHKKKYLGGLKVFLSLLFIMLLSMYSTCYASISDDYLTYSLNQLKTFNGSYSSVLTHCIDVCLTNKTELLSNLINFENQNNLTGLKDVNYSFFISSVERNSAGFYIVISNAGAGTNYLNFIELYNNYITAHENDNSKIYCYEIRVGNTSNYIGYYTPYILGYGQLTSYTRSNYSINNDNDVLTMSTIACAGLPAVYWRYNFSSSGTVYPVILVDSQGNFIVEELEPEEPSGDSPSIDTTGTITNSSGDTTGTIDLSGIQQGIGNIQNQISGDTQKAIDNQNQNTETIVNTISGEVGKITNTLTNQPNLNDTTISSDDIESSLGFDFMADPYANFWYELTNGLRGSLTGSVRQLPVNWLGYEGVFDLDSLGFNYPASVRLILTSVSTVSMVWILVKWWKIIVDKLTSGNMDEVLAMNEEERHY